MFVHPRKPQRIMPVRNSYIIEAKEGHKLDCHEPLTRLWFSYFRCVIFNLHSNEY